MATRSLPQASGSSGRGGEAELTLTRNSRGRAFPERDRGCTSWGWPPTRRKPARRTCRCRGSGTAWTCTCPRRSWARRSRTRRRRPTRRCRSFPPPGRTCSCAGRAHGRTYRSCEPPSSPPWPDRPPREC